MLGEKQSVLVEGKHSHSTPSPSSADKAHLTPNPTPKPSGNQEAFCPITAAGGHSSSVPFWGFKTSPHASTQMGKHPKAVPNHSQEVFTHHAAGNS